MTELSRTSPNIKVKIAAALTVAVGALALAGCSSHGNTAPPPQPTAAVTGEVNLLAGEWGYMPGVVPTGDGLQVGHRGFEIVEQDGSGGQPNPPVNEYGTMLDTTGDFAVDATLQDLKGPASVQLYSTPPEVSDEFRVETPSVRVTIKGGQLALKLWDGKATQNLADQKPAETRTFTISGDSHNPRLEITDSRGQVNVSANGKQLGSLPDEGIFKNGGIWFGLDAEGRDGSFKVPRLTARPLGGGKLMAVNVAAEPAVPKSPTGLQMLTNKKRPGFLVGSDAALWAAVSSPSYDKTLFGGNFGIVTPENDMKWQFVEPQPGVFDFHAADALVAMAKKNGMQVHGHNLVFGEALPQWLQDMPITTAADKAKLKQVLEKHVFTMVQHFKGQVDEWDINEPFAYYDDSDKIPNGGMVNSIFYRAFGENYIKIVCEAAKAADPNVRLWVNDAGAENDTDEFWQSVYAKLKKWKVDWGLPIYGYGFESHIYDPTSDDIATSIDDNGKPTLENHITQLAKIGLKSRVSELDAPLKDPGYAEDDSSQKNEFTGVLRICLGDKGCVAYSMWSTGMTDIWQGDKHELQTGSVDSPFGQNNQPAGPTYTALQGVLR